VDSLALCDRLLESEHVAVVPGGAFGMEGHIRISYASSMEQLERGLDRIEAGLAALRRA
jgi:aspartate/methionine/tyrosine aminotransferase